MRTRGHCVGLAHLLLNGDFSRDKLVPNCDILGGSQSGQLCMCSVLKSIGRYTLGGRWATSGHVVEYCDRRARVVRHCTPSTYFNWPCSDSA